MKKFITLISTVLLMVSCTKHGPLQVMVTNSLHIDRKGELVEVCLNKVFDQVNPSDTADIIVLNESGEQVPYQQTYDGKLIFPVNVVALPVLRVHLNNPVRM